MAPFDTIEVRTDGPVHHITLARPASRNAMSRQMVAELLDALANAQDQDARVIVLRGAGGHFCAGGDIKDMAAARGGDASHAGGHGDPIAELNATFGRLALAYARTQVPVVAVVEGAVMGGGFGLACTADVVIASTTAQFRLPETSLGVVPAQIAPFLVERLGYSEAKRLAVTGARLDAAGAREVGLVHEVVEPGELDARVGATVRQILACAPGAVAATKALLHGLHPGVTEEAIDRAATVFAIAARGDEAAEGMGAFLAKRKPSWAP